MALTAYTQRVEYQRVPSWEFRRRLSYVADRYKPFLSDYSATAIQATGFQCYLASDKASGFMVSNYGEIANIFSIANHENRLRSLVRAAACRGGRYLDCYEGELRERYQALGFDAYDAEPFDDSLAHETWDYAEYGRPDVVFMEMSRQTRNLYRTGRL